MVLLMHAEVEKDDSKDTFACDDDAHKADMGPESQVLKFKLIELLTPLKSSSLPM